MSLKQGWKEKSVLQRIFFVVRLLIDVLVIILAFMQILRIWDKAINISVPLVGVDLLLQSYEQWNNRRFLAVIFIGIAIFIFMLVYVIVMR